MHDRFVRGADKITINTAALDQPELITEAARVFGSQAVVVSIDHVLEPDGSYTVRRQGREATAIDPVAWAREAAARGAGEILLNSVDRDGTADGFDRELIARVVEAVPEIPIIALGGAGRWQHFVAAYEAGANAIAAANIFHFTEMSYKRAKLHMAEQGVPVRIPAKWQTPTT
jgi:cyclase